MYKRFNYSPSSFFRTEIKKYSVDGDRVYSDNQRVIQGFLSKYISKDGRLDGSRIKCDWFSILKYDVFISHSHKDIAEVKAFAGWLHSVFKLNVFIDTNAWGYCDDLLKCIDERLTYNETSETYNYKKRNVTTSHVHIMLSSALAEMINKTECIIFFNTQNSVDLVSGISELGSKTVTESPWIYYELFMTSILPLTMPENRQKTLGESLHMKDSLPIAYNIDGLLQKLTTLTDADLKRWAIKWKNSGENNKALDYLYKIVS